MSKKTELSLMFAILTTLFLQACGTVPIGRILRDPTRYHNRIVQVEGTVSNSFGALDTGAYQLDDGTGKIYVVSSAGVPSRGSRVKVEGMVASGITVMGKSLGTTLRERRHKVRW